MLDQTNPSQDTKSGGASHHRADCNRRQFITGALTSAGVLMAGPTWLRAAQTSTGASNRRATDIVTLGRTGIKTTRLAQGTGYNGSARSSAHTRLGEKAFDELIRHSLDQGIRFI
ncbi:MAG: hypothetical protein AAB403_02170, partial [Planctomycetota bacterium]